MVAILNYGKKSYSEKWNNVLYEIPSLKAIAMIRRDAVAFLGNMSPPDPEAPRGLPLPKMLKIISLSEAKSIIVKTYSEPILPEEKKGYICHFDGKIFDNQEDLEMHLSNLNHKRNLSRRPI